MGIAAGCGRASQFRGGVEVGIGERADLRRSTGWRHRGQGRGVPGHGEVVKGRGAIAGQAAVAARDGSGGMVVVYTINLIDSVYIYIGWGYLKPWASNSDWKPSCPSIGSHIPSLPPAHDLF
jgi:hypothetical protein